MACIYCRESDISNSIKVECSW